MKHKVKLPSIELNNPKLKKSNLQIRSSSCGNYDKTVFNQSLLTSFSTKKLFNTKSSEKSLIKCKLLKGLKKELIMEKTTVDQYKEKYSPVSNKNNKKRFKKKTFFLFTKHNPELIKEDKKPTRYEDCYLTGKEFLKKNFNSREMTIILNDPEYFLLDRPPFIKSNLKINRSLKDILNNEEKNQTNRKTTQLNSVYKRNKPDLDTNFSVLKGNNHYHHLKMSNHRIKKCNIKNIPFELDNRVLLSLKKQKKENKKEIY